MAYNLHVAKEILAGKTMKEAAESWHAKQTVAKNALEPVAVGSSVSRAMLPENQPKSLTELAEQADKAKTNLESTLLIKTEVKKTWGIRGGGLFRKKGKRGNKRKVKNNIDSKDALKVFLNQEEELIQCIVIVEESGQLTYPKISSILIPSDSIERKYKGHPCHLLGLDKKGQLWAIEPENKIEINQSPKDCFIALQYEKEVNECYSLSEGTLEKLKIGLLFLLCFAELIILFLIITTATGGKVA